MDGKVWVILEFQRYALSWVLLGRIRAVFAFSRIGMSLEMLSFRELIN